MRVQSATMPLSPPNDRPVSLRSLLWVIAAVTCVEFFETGMVTFAAAPIMGGLGLRAEEFAFAYTVYGVCAIFMLYKHQWVVERFGYRDFILASLGVFAVGAVLCATADGLTQFAAGRALQGMGGATFFTAGRLQINRLPAEARFSGLLVFIGTLLGATAISPLAAAGLITLGGWQAPFWAMLPLTAAVAWIAGPRLDRDTTPPEARSEEHWGWLLGLVIAVFALQYAIQGLQFELLSHPGQVLATGAASIIALSIFAARQWQRERPLIDYRGLFQLRYLFGIAFYFCGYFMLGLIGFILPILFQHGLGQGMTTTAAVLSASMSCSVIAALAHVTLARRWPRLRPFMLSGLVLLATASLWLGQSAAVTDWQQIIIPTLLVGLAVPIYMGPVAFGTFTQIAPKVFSHAYQVKNIVRQLGLSSAIAVGTLVLEWRYAGHLDAGHASLDWAARLLHGAPASALHAAALAQACADAYTACGLLALALIPVVALQRVFR